MNTLEKYHNEQRRMLETDYRDWLLESNQFKELPKDEASNNNNNSSATNHNMSRQNSIKSFGRQNSTSSSSSQQKTPEPTRQKYKKAVRGLKNLDID